MKKKRAEFFRAFACILVDEFFTVLFERLDGLPLFLSVVDALLGDIDYFFHFDEFVGLDFISQDALNTRLRQCILHCAG